MKKRIFAIMGVFMCGFVVALNVSSMRFPENSPVDYGDPISIGIGMALACICGYYAVRGDR